jgi:choice-of-anchor B domain-containing protein
MRIRRCISLFCLALMAALPARADYGDITLVGSLPLPSITRITNVWGWINPATHIEYALVGDWFGGFYIVDVSDPMTPFVVTKYTGASAFDLKVWGTYLYCCDGNASGRDTRIVDISTPGVPVLLPTKMRSCHTISISTRGNMFFEYEGVTGYDLVNNPEDPDSLFHIINQGHDSTPRDDRLYDFNGGVLNIWDISDPANPVHLGGDNDPTVGYYHGGDESPDRNYLYVCDEFAVSPNPDIVIYDISDPTMPTRIGDINDPTSRVHQLYVSGNLMFVGYYTAGFKVFDITNPAVPVLADTYDTSPFQTENGPDVYSGAYNAYPYTPGGIVYVADHPEGLFLFSVEGHTGQPTAVTPRSQGGARLGLNHPNPFNPVTTVEYEMDRAMHARLRIYDVSGALVRTLLDERVPAGPHQARWDGRDESGRAVASGVYYCRLEAGTTRATLRMVLLK